MPRILNFVTKSVYMKSDARQATAGFGCRSEDTQVCTQIYLSEWQAICSFSAELNLSMRKTLTAHKTALSMPEGHL